MSGVDVLAVMDEFQSREEQRADEAVGINKSIYCVRAASLSQAQAAVAELIEQAQRCVDSTGDLSDLRAALAKATGATDGR